MNGKNEISNLKSDSEDSVNDLKYWFSSSSEEEDEAGFEKNQSFQGGYVDWDPFEKKELTLEAFESCHLDFIRKYARFYPDLFITGHRNKHYILLNIGANITGAYETHLDPNNDHPKLLSYNFICQSNEHTAVHQEHLEYTCFLTELTLEQKKWIICPDPYICNKLKREGKTCPFSHNYEKAVHYNYISEHIQCPNWSRPFGKYNNYKKCERTNCPYKHVKPCKTKWCFKRRTEDHNFYHRDLCCYEVNSGDDIWGNGRKISFKHYYPYKNIERANLAVAERYENIAGKSILEKNYDLSERKTLDIILDDITEETRKSTLKRVNQLIFDKLSEEDKERFGNLSLDSLKDTEGLLKFLTNDFGF